MKELNSFNLLFAQKKLKNEKGKNVITTILIFTKNEEEKI
jgi:hypothetical protein